MSWRELALTPIIQSILILVTLFLTWVIQAHFSFDTFLTILTFCFVLVALTMIFMRLLITIFPFQEGRFVIEQHPWVFYRWSLWGYLYTTHLYFLYRNLLIPSMFRKPFYQFLGAKIGRGIIAINAVIIDPQMIEIGENVIIGEDSLIVGHLITDPGRFMMKKIKIGDGVLVGVRSVIMPGVEIGDNAMIKAGSIVYPGTVIGPHELWEGNPAQKIGMAKSTTSNPLS